LFSNPELHDAFKITNYLENVSEKVCFTVRKLSGDVHEYLSFLGGGGWRHFSVKLIQAYGLIHSPESKFPSYEDSRKVPS
jgi:hypothetical protein